MIVQDVGFTGVSVFEGNTPRVFESSESAVESRACARACGFMNNPG